MLPVTGLEAVGIGEDGTSERLYQVGWNGSLDALARSETTGFALHRTGKSVIEYRRVGQNLVMESSVDLSAQHRRLMRGYSGGAVEEHWYFGGEPVVEVYWGQPQRLMELWFDPRFIRLESGIPLGTSLAVHSLLPSFRRALKRALPWCVCALPIEAWSYYDD